MSDSAQRYRVVEKLESGGMAEVFRAESEGLQGFKKQVAIKRVLPHLSEKKKFISMFLDEARLSAHLSHSNCVQVFDIGVGDNAYFIVMEFVDGANLKAIAESLRKAGRDFPVEAAIFIAHEICKGLSYAHELKDPQGNDLFIVHRDMSPPNVLVTKYGEIKIVDFGLAKANSQLERSEPGIIKGKFSYLSPEAALGQDVDARTDIFAVGIILWELLCGQRLFLGETDFQTVKKVQQAVIPPVSQFNKKVAPELEKIVNKTLARDPKDRYQTARDLGRDLAKYMFALAKPVSSFEIESLVQGAMRERQRVRPQQHSIIDKLIEEALLEFTSLKEDEIPGEGDQKKADEHHSRGPAPLNLGDFEDPSQWMSEISISDKNAPPRDSLRNSIPDGAFEEGNLSALEEDEEPSRPSSGNLNSPSSSVPPPPVGMGGMGGGGMGGGMGMGMMGASPSAPMQMPGPPQGMGMGMMGAPQHTPLPLPHGHPHAMHSPAPPMVAHHPQTQNLRPLPPVNVRSVDGKSKGAAVGAVVVLATAAAVAAAWFTHLIPHN
ncbi:MAG: Serine/threonine protein kinase [Myxococcaceae bacterium]|nr:Serine/threonine protein kinase [Myxococcaceae bacterium]